jgi:hypothetical protein
MYIAIIIIIIITNNNKYNKISFPLRNMVALNVLTLY